jgi:hypothetical protein
MFIGALEPVISNKAVIVNHYKNLWYHLSRLSDLQRCFLLLWGARHNSIKPQNPAINSAQNSKALWNFAIIAKKGGSVIG